MKSRASLFWIFAGLALAACPRTNQPEVGGETNWLRVCTDRDGCGVGSCVCGVCTTECSAESRCSGAFTGSCVSTASELGASACAETEQMPAGLCLPGCSTDVECGAGFSCRDSVCVSESTAERFDAVQVQSSPSDAARQTGPDGQDAGMCRVADRCELGVMCDLATARARVPACARPFGGSYLARCGLYDSIVSAGIDSSITYYYGADGALLGTNSGGLTSEPGCVSYDASFTLPLSCMQTSPRCEDDAGTADAGTGDAMDAGTADTGTDAGQQEDAAALCDCASDQVSLACVCAQGQNACRTFEQAATNVSCLVGPVAGDTVERGCGYTRVNHNPYNNYLYEGAENTLVGAQIYIDVPFGTCSRPVYTTQMPDLKACADYSICDLCPNGANAPCQL